MAMLFIGSGSAVVINSTLSTTAGNARGNSAVDFQTDRSAATQVASGAYSFVGSGRRNTASGSQNVVVGGFANTAQTGANVFIGAGSTNTVSSNYSAVVAGYGNSVTNSRAFIGGGKSNSITASYGVICGGLNNSISSGSKSAIVSGKANTASGEMSVVVGGYTNTASSAYAVVCGGKYNEAKTNYCTIVVGGRANVATGKYSFIGGGRGHATSATYSTISGGKNNVASGTRSTVSGGITNTASGGGSTVIGGNNNTASSYYTCAGGIDAIANKWGQFACSSGQFSIPGDAQRSAFVLRKQTTDATQTELFLNNSSSRMTIASDTTWAFRMLIVARRTDADNESAGYTVDGVIDNNAGTTALVGTITKTVVAEDTAAWDVDVQADDTNDALVVKVTGEAAKTIRWVCTVWTSEVTG